MNYPITPTELALLCANLPSAISPSMLDGYLAASASGPNFAMPDQVLRWVWASGQQANQVVANLIIRYYQAVNNALNDQVYSPILTDPQPWCRGYMAGFAADMTAWTPLTAVQPALLKVVMSGAGKKDMADAVGRIHAFWVERRRQSMDIGGYLAQLAALTPNHAAQSNQRLH